MHALAARLGLPDCHIHDLRHDYATTGLRLGVERKPIGRLLGHANEAMTGYYQWVDDPLLHAAAETIAQARRLPADAAPELDLEAVLQRNPDHADVAQLAAEVSRLRTLIGRGLAGKESSNRETA